MKAAGTPIERPRSVLPVMTSTTPHAHVARAARNMSRARTLTLRAWYPVFVRVA